MLLKRPYAAHMLSKRPYGAHALNEAVRRVLLHTL
jgi:hypothetical protein